MSKPEDRDPAAAGKRQSEVSGPNGKADRFVISSIIVLAVCSDGKCRLVRLNDNQPRRLFRYLDGMCDHRVNLIMAPVKVVLEQMPKKKNFLQRAINSLGRRSR
jgi:hypothetical protein